MTTLRQKALDIGGYFLLRAFTKQHINAARKRLSMPQPDTSVRSISSQDVRLDDVAEETFQQTTLADVLTMRAEDLSTPQKAWLREHFYIAVNMSAMALRAWYQGPFVALGASNRPYMLNKAKKRIRSIILIKMTRRRDGFGWKLGDYETAQDVIFVYQMLYNPRLVDVETWAALHNFGHDWTRTDKQGTPRRKLPAEVTEFIENAVISSQ